MDKQKVYIALISNGLTKELVWYRKEFNINVLVFVKMNLDEVKFEIQEMAWQDRAEWVSMVPFRAYGGWKREDIIEMEELLKSPGTENVYVDY